MLNHFRAVALCVFAIGALLATPVASQTCPALLNHTFPRLQDESPQPLCQYQGRVLLVV
ncbi:MAG TPA: glutathione peroxidase, partial [Burkholderiaceae bacterium]|nr:glutathione peroxidase [Burkholderiaceae bacterium]